MPDCKYPELLGLVVNTEACKCLFNPELQDCSQHDEEHDGLKQALLDPNFIRFFLNFLREASAPVIKGSEADSPVLRNGTGVKENAKLAAKDGAESLGETVHHMMSTPKVRDDILNPMSYQNLSTSSLRTPVPSKNCGNPQVLSDTRKQSGRSGSKPKREPLSLSDFLSPEPGYPAAQSWSKKKTQKRGKRVHLTPASGGRDQCSMSNATAMRSEVTFSPRLTNISDAKSPVNPLFSEASRNISFDIDEFPALSAPQNASHKPPRRIKPTVVNAHQAARPKILNVSGSQKFCENGQNDLSNPFTSAPAIAPSPGKDLTEERDLLLKMKACSKNLDLSSGGVDLTQPEKSIKDISPVKKCNVALDLRRITNRVKVDRIAQLYSYFINCFLVPNIVSELHFIIELLTLALPKHKTESTAHILSITGSLCDSSESTVDDASENIQSSHDLLSTALNCVYFSITVIQCLVSSNILSILSRSTLSLLAQNHTIQVLFPNLPTQVLCLVEKLEIKEKDVSAERYISNEKMHSISSVMFEAETDDRSNFPSDKAFHAFRKHRDLFYALIREYDDRRHDQGFQVQRHLSMKIKNLVSQVKTSGTYKPFVRLFISQMLQEVGQGGRITPVGDASFFSESMNNPGRVDLLSLLRQGDPEKFRRLQSRFFTTSNSLQTHRSKDILFEECFFYKEFVICADSYAINTHLCKELRRRITELQSQQAQQILDDALVETANAASVSSALRTLISSARVMGRFLGFIVFEPYCVDESASSYDPSLLLHASNALDTAYHNKHEIATVPWVVEYLKSAKFNESPITSEVETLAGKLFSVFSRRSCGGIKILKPGDVLVCLMITTLLDMCIFPDEFFYYLLKKNLGQYCPKTISVDSDKGRNGQVEEVENATFDECCADLVSFSLIYDANPALRDIRSLIISNNAGAVKANQPQQPSRKIKPNREKDQEGTLVRQKEKQLQHTLEEHFFRGQPSSLKRTVEFVAERCASNCVKRVRSISMLDVCNKAENLALKQLQENRNTLERDNAAKGLATREIITEMQAFAKDRMNKECDEFCDKAVPQCLEDLSSCETADGVLKLATAIAKKKAVASVRLWLRTRLEELVSVSVKARLTRVFASMDMGDCAKFPPTRSYDFSCERFTELDSFSSLLQTMKECIVKMTFKADQDQSITICSNLPEQLNMSDVASLLQIADYLLGESTEDHKYTKPILSMRQLLHSSPHLKSTLALVCKELDTCAKQHFEG